MVKSSLPILKSIPFMRLRNFKESRGTCFEIIYFHSKKWFNEFLFLVCFDCSCIFFWECKGSFSLWNSTNLCEMFHIWFPNFETEKRLASFLFKPKRFLQVAFCYESANFCLSVVHSLVQKVQTKQDQRKRLGDFS